MDRRHLEALRYWAGERRGSNTPPPSITQELLRRKLIFRGQIVATAERTYFLTGEGLRQMQLAEH